MEIKGPGRIASSGVKGKGKKAATQKTGFGKALSREKAVSAPNVSPTPGGTTPLTAVNGLLSLQEMAAEGATEGKSRSAGMARASLLLDHLEAIRHGLLAGQIPQSRLSAIAAAVAREKNQGDNIGQDPALYQILDDVELRVRVELAKLEQ